MMSVATNNCESGIPGDGEGIEPHNHSLRWHAYLKGRTYIVYADNLSEAVELLVRHTADEHIARQVVPSGYYCQRVNAIYQAKDGPTVYVDNSNGRLT